MIENSTNVMTEEIMIAVAQEMAEEVMIVVTIEIIAEEKEETRGIPVTDEVIERNHQNMTMIEIIHQNQENLAKMLKRCTTASLHYYRNTYHTV